MGSWTVLGGGTTVSVTPNSGSGAQQTFALQYVDPLGAADLTSVWVWITANYGTESNSCLVEYASATNLLYLYNDAGTSWLPAVTPGTGVTLSNSQCSMNVAAASVTASGTDLILNLPVAFTAAYNGAKSIYMYAGGSIANSGWQNLGSWTVSAQPAALSVASTHGGSFTQGQTGAVYTVAVSNALVAGPTGGPVTVTDTLPGGLTLGSMAGTGWTCSNTCTRSDVLVAGSSYPAIAVVVNVAANTSGTVVNSVNVSGGGSAPASGSDNTVILGFNVSVTPPVLQSAPAGSVNPLNYPISIASSGGFNSMVTLSLSGLPAGVTPTWYTEYVYPGQTPAPLNVTVGSGTAAGSYTLTITGTGTGVPTPSTAQVVLVVQPPPFTLSISQSPQSVQQNQTAYYTISALSSTGYSAPIALSWYTSGGGGFACAAGGLPQISSISTLTPIYAGQQETAWIEPSNVSGLTQTQTCQFSISVSSGSIAYILSGELDVTPVAGFTLTLNQPVGPPSVTPPSSGTVQANYPINVTSHNGYSGTVNFTAAFTGTSVPQGVSFYSIGQVYISSGGSGSTTVTANVPPGVAAGQYWITITGADSTGATHSVNAILNIQQGADFTLSVSSPQNIQQSQFASYTISMAPAGTGFNGTVTLNMGAITGGVTGSLSTTVISAGSPATLTLNAQSNASLGTYPILVNGIATTGTISHSVLAVLGVTLGTNPVSSISVGTVAVPPGSSAGITVSSPVLLGNGAVCSLSQGSTGITAMPNVGTQTITFTATSSAGSATATCTTGAAAGPQLLEVPLLPDDLIDLSVTPDGAGVWDLVVSSDDPDVVVLSMTVSIYTRLPNGQYSRYFLSAPPEGDNDFTVYWAAGAPCGTYNVAMAYVDDNYDDGPIFANASADLCYEDGSAPLQATTSPAKVVAGAGSQFSVTASASGGSPGYSYAWSLISQAGDDPTVAQFCNAQGVCSTTQLGPNCSPQSTCTATIQGVKGGKATLQVTVTDSASNQATAQTRLIIVSFSQLTVTAAASVGGSPPTQTNPPPQTACFSTQPPQPPQIPCFSPQVLTGPLQWPSSSDTAWLTTVTPLVFIENSTPTIVVSATTTPPATDPDVTITLAIARAPDDTSGATCQQNIPSVASLGSGAATVALNQCGSFQVLAFIDTNGNGIRDNNETGVAFPLIVVEAQLLSGSNDGSTANPLNLDILAGSTGVNIITGSTDLDDPGLAAVSLQATVTFVGGGESGLRGTERVFAGWAQNEEGQNEFGTYGTAPGQHYFTWLPLANPTAATSSFPIANGPPAPMFVPGVGNAAAVPQPSPVLDAQPTAFGSGTSGGNDPTLGPLQTRQSQNSGPFLGAQFLVSGVDSLSEPFPLAHPAYGGPALVQCQMVDAFEMYLVVWASSAVVVSGGVPAGTSAATQTMSDRLYGLLIMQPWSISAMYGINNGQPTDIGTPTITLNPSAAVTFPTATGLSSLSPFLVPFLVPPILVAIEGVNAQQ
jgi:hypothetical protein